MRSVFVRVLAALVAVVFSSRLPAQTATPTAYNLQPFAYDIYHAGDTSKIAGSVRWLHICDSYGDLPSLGRFAVGVRDCVKPYRWSGWYHPSASSGLNPAPTAADPAWTVTPVHAAPTGLFYNHFTFATTQTGNAGTNDGNNYSIGFMCNGNGGAAVDTTNGPVGNANAMYTRFPTINSRALGWKTYPHQFRELAFAGNVADSTICFEWAMDYRVWNRFQSRAQPTSTASKYGNWGVDGDVVTARLIYVKSPEAPSSLVWRTTRNGSTSNSVTFTPRGPLAIASVDADFTAASTSSTGNYLRPRILTDALGTNESAGGSGANTILPILGVRYFRPNTPGLEFTIWSQPGWNTTQFYDYATYDTLDPQAVTDWLTALGWPTNISVQLGQNQSNTQVTELNAGTTTTFESNYQSLVDLVNNRYDAAGRGRPRWLFIAPWRLQSDFNVGNGRTELNYTAVATAIYNRALANGAAFYNFQSIQQTPEDFSNQDPDGGGAAPATRVQILWSSDNVHQNATGAGSLYYVGSLWSAMETSLDAPASGLRGRGRASWRKKHPGGRRMPRMPRIPGKSRRPRREPVLF